MRVRAHVNSVLVHARVVKCECVCVHVWLLSKGNGSAMFGERGLQQWLPVLFWLPSSHHSMGNVLSVDAWWLDWKMGLTGRTSIKMIQGASVCSSFQVVFIFI